MRVKLFAIILLLVVGGAAIFVSFGGLPRGASAASTFLTGTAAVADVSNDVAATGTIADRTTLIRIRDGAGFPDGMTVDAEGFLWVALWDGWGVERYAPDGRLDRRVEVPAQQASSCAFGGPDLDLLFITTAQEGFPPGGKPDQPHAGGLFVCRPGVRGRPSFRFAG